MDSEQRIQLVGMALLRGLLDESRLRQALETEGELLEALQAQGTLDEEDLKDLERLLHPDSGGAGLPVWQKDPVTAPHFSARGRDPWDSLPSDGDETDGTGRQVLRVLTLPTWKHYRNLRFVAEGGMGRVFKAFDSSLKRVVALKFLRRDDPELVRRFVLEAQNQAKVDHPNICKVFEVGEWQGQSYIAMQFIQGETLESAAASMSLVDRVKVMEAVAEGVHAAHRQGLIHRDLKPANIMVEPGERGYKPSILDFGLARGLESTGMTIQGMLIGTVHYMAPEQARGEHESVGRRTDVYGLGATLHRVLTGQAPFPGSEGLEAVRRTLEEDVPSLHRLVPDLPEDLDTIVRKCLEKDSNRRYESALAVAEDLRRWREGEPILARKPTFRYLAGKWARKHKLVVAVGTVGLVGLMVVGAIAIRTRLNAVRQAQFAQFFGQESERVEALLRYIRLSQPHDIEREMAGVEDRIRAIRTLVAKGGRLAQGPGRFALGRVALALDQPREARVHFEAARKAGYQDSELDLLDARALVHIHQIDLMQARQIPDPLARSARLNELKAQLRKEVRRLLESGFGAGLTPGAYQQGILALVEGRTEEARSLGRQITESSPWFYEAEMLVSDAFAADALGAPDRKSGLQYLDLALEALERCHAPSDPALLRRRIRLLLLAESIQTAGGVAPVQEIQAIHLVTQQWRVIQPHSGEIPFYEAYAQVERQGWDILHGKLNSAEAQRAEAMAREVLQHDPENPEAQGLLARALMIHARTSRYLTGRPIRTKQEEALRLALQALERDPLQNGLVTLVASLASDLISTLREEGRSAEEWVSVVRHLETMAKQFPDLAYVSHALSLVSMELAESERVEGQDPSHLVEVALEAAHRFQRLRPDASNGFRAEANASIVMAWHLLYQNQDPNRQADQGFEASVKAIALNPASYLDEINATIALRIKAEYLLRQGKDPIPLIRAAEERIKRARRIDSTDWYHAFLSADLACLEAQWVLQGGGRPDPILLRLGRLFDQAWIRSDVAEAALIKVRLARLRWRAQIGSEAEAWRALGNLERRFPKMPETNGERRLFGAIRAAGKPVHRLGELES